METQSMAQPGAPEDIHNMEAQATPQPGASEDIPNMEAQATPQPGASEDIHNMEAQATPQPGSSEDIDNMEAQATPQPATSEYNYNLKIKRYRNPRGKDCCYELGHLLSIAEIYMIIINDNKNNVSDSEAKLLQTLKKVSSHHFQHTQVPLPVSSLKHVTEESALHGIYEEECFRITKCDQRPEFGNLSFWSADVSLTDINKARQMMYEDVSKVITPDIAHRFEGEIKEQFSNSPAFKESSRYGNFVFSFPLSYLLDLYKAQHCGGEEPQLRILGTELYRLEIAHYIVVHSPHINQYDDFPMVPAIQTGSSASLPFVYRDRESLYWRPESTSIALKVGISKEGQVQTGCYQNCAWYIHDGKCCHLHDGIYSVWNQLIVAFHLPDGSRLNIPAGHLLEHLATCDTESPYLGERPLLRQKAEEVIKRLRNGPNSDQDLSEEEPCQ